MANYPQELVQDAVCQSHTGHMTGLWFLPVRPLRLNTNECGDTCAVQGYVVTVRAVTAYRGSLTSAIAGGECLLHPPAALPWQGTQAGLKDSKKKQYLAAGGTRTPASPA